jgi:HK97 family phage major capsid protein
MNYRELQNEIDAKNAELAGIFTKHRKEDGSYDMTLEVVEDVRRRNDEITDLGVKRDAARQVDEVYQKNLAAMREAQQPDRKGGFPGGAPDDMRVEEPKLVKSIGELFSESPIYQELKGQSRSKFVVEIEGVSLKTTMTTAAGYAAANDRTPKVVPFALRRPVVADLIPQVDTTLSSIKYMEETTNTNNAATVAQNAEKPESALAFTERTRPVEKIATTLPVTDEQLADVPSIRSTIDNRLGVQIQLTEEAQLLEGDGNTPNLLGFYNASGLQTQAKGADPTPDAVYKAITKVRHTGFADPTGTVWHPNDWQDVRLLRTADGIYIWGSPAEAGPERIWGLPAIITTANTENSVLVGDFSMYSEIFRRQGVTIEAGFVGDDFRYNRRTLRAEERLALVIYRGAAFCEVTGV